MYFTILSLLARQVNLSGLTVFDSSLGFLSPREQKTSKLIKHLNKMNFFKTVLSFLSHTDMDK